MEANTRRVYLPHIDDEAAIIAIREHLTAEQIYEIAQALEFVRSQTGHGSVAIEIKAGLPRFVSTTMSKELR